MCVCSFFFFKQKTAYEMRISDWSSDVCSSDLPLAIGQDLLVGPQHQRAESAEKDALLLNHLDILAVDLPVLADVHQVDARDLADARLPSLWRVEIGRAHV